MDAARELETMDTSHEPSYSRGLVRLAKKIVADGSDISPIVDTAFGLKDPYYAAYTLSCIAKIMNGAGMNGYESLFRDACVFAGRVPQEWRRAEIITKVAADMSHSGVLDFSDATKVIADLTEEKPRQEAFRGLFRSAAKTQSPQGFCMLEYASDDREVQFMVKMMVNEYLKNNSTDISRIEKVILGIEEPSARSKGLTYLGMKMSRRDIPRGRGYFETAVKTSSDVRDGPPRLELIKYITDRFIASDAYDLSRVLSAPDMLCEISDKVSLLGYMAGKMSRYGREGYPGMFEEALSKADMITDPELRYRVLRNIAKGMERAGLKGYEDALDKVSGELAAEAGNSNQNLSAGCHSTAKKKSIEVDQKSSGLPSAKPDGRRRVVTLGLYNTYEKKISPAHVRAAARAAPLCCAYGLDLCLFNFPFEDEEETVQKVINDTSVGRGGYYLAQLNDEGRFHVRQDIYGGGFGVLVVTTPHPDPNKIFAANAISKSKDMCFLLGVGKSGLPGPVLSYAGYHLELSGRDIPFETCTAMGILAFVLKDM